MWRQPNGTLILGDVGVVFLEAGTGDFKHPILLTEAPGHVFLPISSEFMLVGTRNEGLEFDSKALNKAQAALSRDFFVSAVHTEKELEYQGSIGSKADLIYPEEISELLRSNF
jgi:hypothetical protein